MVRREDVQGCLKHRILTEVVDHMTYAGNRREPGVWDHAGRTCAVDRTVDDEVGATAQDLDRHTAGAVKGRASRQPYGEKSGVLAPSAVRRSGPFTRLNGKSAAIWAGMVCGRNMAFQSRGEEQVVRSRRLGAGKPLTSYGHTTRAEQECLKARLGETDRGQRYDAGDLVGIGEPVGQGYSTPERMA